MGGNHNSFRHILFLAEMFTNLLAFSNFFVAVGMEEMRLKTTFYGDHYLLNTFCIEDMLLVFYYLNNFLTGSTKGQKPLCPT